MRVKTYILCATKRLAWRKKLTALPCHPIERFSTEFCKTKTKVITLANHKDTDNPVSQSVLKEVTSSWRKARENEWFSFWLDEKGAQRGMKSLYGSQLGPRSHRFSCVAASVKLLFFLRAFTLVLVFLTLNWNPLKQTWSCTRYTVRIYS